MHPLNIQAARNRATVGGRAAFGSLLLSVPYQLPRVPTKVPSNPQFAYKHATFL